MAQDKPASAPADSRAGSSAPLAVLKGVRIGDSATFGAQIVALKPYPVTPARMPAFQTSFTLSEPAHLIWIEVVPGKSIALLYPTSGSTLAMAPTGLRSADFHYTAVAGSGVASAQNITGEARNKYYDCVNGGERAAEAATRRRQASQPKPQPKRDREGHIIEEAPPPEPIGVDLAARKQIEARCQVLLKGGANGSGEVVRAERYLVLLASYLPLTATQLNARLDALEVTASSVRGTIEAIAQGIYLDPHADWAGYYVAW